MSAPAIHPTAIIDPRAELAADVRVGPYAVIEGAVIIGAGTIVRPHAHLIGPLVMGEGNDVGSSAVLGDRPQHLGYDGTETTTTIGNHNTFREHVTVHRPMPGGRTLIGDHNYFMASSHVAHDCTVGNHCIMANSAVLAGHVTIHDRIFLSAFVGIHQHCQVGELAMLSGMAAATKDVPPYWLQQRFNIVCGVNVVGMKRAGIPQPEIMAVRKAFKMIYIQQMGIREATDAMEADLGHYPAIQKVVAFIRNSKRGICGPGRYDANRDLADAA